MSDNPAQDAESVVALTDVLDAINDEWTVPQPDASYVEVWSDMRRVIDVAYALLRLIDGADV